MSGFFGPEFAPKPEFVRQGFDRVFSDVTLPEGALRALFEDYASMVPKGSPRTEEQILAQHLEGLEWEWPWFDQWRDRFAEVDLWPYMWERYALFWRACDRPGPDAALQRQKIVILAHTVSTAICTARDIASGQQSIRMFGDKWGVWRLQAGDPQIDAHFLPGRSKSVGAGDFALAPPAFPGDRAGIGFSPLRR